jgi:hypothetical protein
VVAERDHVGTRGQEPRRQLRRDPDAVGGVLAVEDAERDAELVLQPRQALLDGPPTGRANDVSDEQDLQRTGSSAAGRTDTDTLLPASCV